MDPLDEWHRQYSPTRNDILEAVDEYTLYCHYLENEKLPIEKRILSPLRDEKDPSFIIFQPAEKRPFEYLWKDHGLGMHGSIFDLIKILYTLGTYREVYALICQDFELDFKTEKVNASKIVHYSKPIVTPIKLKVHPVPYSKKGNGYWSDLNIGIERLQKFDTKQIDYYWSTEGQEAPTSVLDPTFVYTIGKYYQIYSPYADKEFKFRNDLPENYFFGYLQLPKTGDKLIIDKSAKDMIFDDVLGYSAVAGKSETTMIPPSKMLELKSRFSEIYLTLDPDPAGQRQTEKYLKLYPWLKARFLREAKDKTDLCKLVGFTEAKRIITNLIQ